MTSLGITPPQAFDYTDGSRTSAGTRWPLWISDMDIFLAATGIDDERRRLNVMLNQAGREVRDICRTNWPTTETYKEVKEKLAQYFKPAVNEDFARYEFSMMRQGEKGHAGEGMEDFATRLRAAAGMCGFDESQLEREIKRQMLCGTSSEFLRKELLEAKKDDRVADVLKRAKEKKTIQDHIKSIGQGPTPNSGDVYKPDTLAAISMDQRKRVWTSNRSSLTGGDRHGAYDRRKVKGPAKKEKQCFNCKRAYPHNGPCPAAGKKCRSCGAVGHFEIACRKGEGGGSKRGDVKAVTSEKEKSYLFTMSDGGKTKPTIEVLIGTTVARVMIDSGAEEVVIDEPTFARMRPSPKLSKPRSKLYPYGSNQPPLEQVGEFVATIQIDERASVEAVRVMKGNAGCILGHMAARRLGLYQSEMFGDLGRVMTVRSREADELARRYPTVFNDKVGKLKDFQVKLHIDESVTPKQQPRRPIGFNLVAAVDAEIDRLISNDIWEPVDKPSG